LLLAVEQREKYPGLSGRVKELKVGFGELRVRTKSQGSWAHAQQVSSTGWVLSEWSSSVVEC
jgi:hypothetical protein